jgi:hypothetical protein
MIKKLDAPAALHHHICVARLMTDTSSRTVAECGQRTLTGCRRAADTAYAYVSTAAVLTPAATTSWAISHFRDRLALPGSS